jgi:hypothetical protein
MEKRIRVLGWVGAALGAASAVYALTPPSDSDGPVKLLACVVSASGMLEAEIDNSADKTMRCDIRCGYELGEHRFSHTFNLSIPARFQGRLGRFDTHNARPGNYSGDVGNCDTP